MQKLWIVLIGLFVLTACAGQSAEEAGNAGSGENRQTLTLMSHDSFAISEEVLAAFEAEHNVDILLLPSGDAGAALNQAILAADNPLADLFFGVDNAFMGRALAAGIFEPYQSRLLAEIDDAFKLDDSYALLPVDFGDVCLNYDKAWFAETGLELPDSLVALTEPQYKSLLVVENPATSSPGLAFMLATVGEFGAEGDYTFLNYWADLRENEVLVANGWEDAYYGQFSVAGEGERPLVVSYASSPPAEFIYADPPVVEPPSASLVEPGMCFRQIEFVGILKGTEQRELAEKLIDYMLSQPFQEDIPLNMFVFPVNGQAKLPQAFTDWAQIPADPGSVSPEEIDANRDVWIEAWTEVVLR